MFETRPRNGKKKRPRNLHNVCQPVAKPRTGRILAMGMVIVHTPLHTGRGRMMWDCLLGDAQLAWPNTTDMSVADPQICALGPIRRFVVWNASKQGFQSLQHSHSNRNSTVKRSVSAHKPAVPHVLHTLQSGYHLHNARNNTPHHQSQVIIIVGVTMRLSRAQCCALHATP